MDCSFKYTPQQVCSELKVNPDQGLARKEIQARELKYGILLVIKGKNELPDEPQTPLYLLVLEQFQDQLVIILLIAAFISFVLAFLDGGEGIGAYVEPIVILLILIANAVVGVVQETNAEKAIEEFSPDEAKVIRDGHLSTINSIDLVPGDIVVLAVGDKVPADCRLVSITSSSFKVDQAILTGEPFSISKDAECIVKDEKSVKQDQLNMVFSGTTVTVGKATGVVVNIGTKTAIGAIHDSISSQIQEKTPLKQALDDFGDQLARIITVICILVWLINIRHFQDEHFGAVALAVAAIPEGLAVIITTCLALGTQKMAAQGFFNNNTRAIVRKLRSCETLGCTSVICSDKTGTLTTNEMSVRRLITFESQSKFLELEIEGDSFAPAGKVLKKTEKELKEINKKLLSNDACLQELLHICSLCNDSKIIYDPIRQHYTKVGEPTEAALKVLCEKVGAVPTKNDEGYVTKETLSKLTNEEKIALASTVDDYYLSLYKRHATFEFSRDRKSMSVLVESKKSDQSSSSSSSYFTRGSVANSSGKKMLFVKGAPENILTRCEFVRVGNSYETPIKMTDEIRKRIHKKAEMWGENESLRVLAFATVDKPTISTVCKQIETKDYIKYESQMTFIGLVAMLDPPRPEVRRSIEQCREAGIRVIVITGDNQKTAESICRSIGVFETGQDLSKLSFTGREFDAMNHEEKVDALMHACLFSRTEPTHKSVMVDYLKKQGLVVAMTGDGVNDAPALKKADIGIAMGSGTDVAKLASDMVLADDNFSTIVSAVQEGRSIYANTKQFIRYLISSNIGEVVSIFLTVVLGMPEALIPVQLLWVNLVTDGLPATALGFNPADHDIMYQAPRDSKEPIVTKWYMVIGTYVGCATVFGYAWWFVLYSHGPQISFHQLTNFHSCSKLFPEIGCEMFTNEMSHKATTMSLSVLVVVEMFNAINSLSENESLITFPLWNNMYLVGAITLSMILHLMILYVPFFTQLFSITSLNMDEWYAVLWISAPVILVDEVLKYVSRSQSHHVVVEKLKAE